MSDTTAKYLTEIDRPRIPEGPVTTYGQPTTQDYGRNPGQSNILAAPDREDAGKERLSADPCRLLKQVCGRMHEMGIKDQGGKLPKQLWTTLKTANVPVNGAGDDFAQTYIELIVAEALGPECPSEAVGLYNNNQLGGIQQLIATFVEGGQIGDSSDQEEFDAPGGNPVDVHDMEGRTEESTDLSRFGKLLKEEISAPSSEPPATDDQGTQAQDGQQGGEQPSGGCELVPVTPKQPQEIIEWLRTELTDGTFSDHAICEVLAELRDRLGLVDLIDDQMKAIDSACQDLACILALKNAIEQNLQEVDLDGARRQLGLAAGHQEVKGAGAKEARPAAPGPLGDMGSPADPGKSGEYTRDSYLSGEDEALVTNLNQILANLNQAIWTIKYECRKAPILKRLTELYNEKKPKGAGPSMEHEKGEEGALGKLGEGEGWESALDALAKPELVDKRKWVAVIQLIHTGKHDEMLEDEFKTMDGTAVVSYMKKFAQEDRDAFRLKVPEILAITETRPDKNEIYKMVLQVQPEDIKQRIANRNANSNLKEDSKFIRWISSRVILDDPEIKGAEKSDLGGKESRKHGSGAQAKETPETIRKDEGGRGWFGREGTDLGNLGSLLKEKLANRDK